MMEQRVAQIADSIMIKFLSHCQQHGVNATTEVINNFHSAKTFPEKVKFYEKTFGLASFEAEVYLQEANNNTPQKVEAPKTTMQQQNIAKYLLGEKIGFCLN